MATSGGSVVILTGPVGAGKTTVARELVESSAGSVACIEGDTYWSHIVRAQPDQDRNANFRMIMRAMTASARHYDRDGYEVILDFSIPPWYLDAIRALLTGKPFDYVIVRPSLAICAARAAARPEGAIADYTPYRELYDAFDGYERFTVGGDGAGPALTAARIREGLAAGAFRMK